MKSVSIVVFLTKILSRLEIAAWSEERNQQSRSVDWRFTNADARIKLKRLYPSIQT